MYISDVSYAVRVRRCRSRRDSCNAANNTPLIPGAGDQKFAERRTQTCRRISTRRHLDARVKLQTVVTRARYWNTQHRLCFPVSRTSAPWYRARRGARGNQAGRSRDQHDASMGWLMLDRWPGHSESDCRVTSKACSLQREIDLHIWAAAPSFETEFGERVTCLALPCLD
jgi:hypothetical protein